jgi:orotate phosphoribosyltransferase
LLSRTALTEQVSNSISRRVYEQFETNMDTIVAPALGAIIFGHSVARLLSDMNRKKEVRFVPAEKQEKIFVFKGLTDCIKYARVVVIEDTVTTGGSLKKVVDTIRQNKGEVLGAFSIINRGHATAESLGVPYYYALEDVSKDPEFQSWAPGPETCPMCRDGIPLDLEYGHGRG